tara:strand:+ start:7856 stop:8890 length:1035 start_codon:yes stop_codon:yes gene_type:complete
MPYTSEEARKKQDEQQEFQYARNLAEKQEREKALAAQQSSLSVRVANEDVSSLQVANAESTLDDDSLSAASLEDKTEDSIKEDSIIWKTINKIDLQLEVDKSGKISIFSSPPKDASFKEKFAVTTEVFLTAYLQALEYATDGQKPEIRINGGCDKVMVQQFYYLADCFKKSGLLGECHLPLPTDRSGSDVETWIKELDMTKTDSGIIKELQDLLSVKDVNDIAPKVTSLYLGTPSAKLTDEALEEYYRNLYNKSAKSGSSDAPELNQDELDYLSKIKKDNGIYNSLHGNDITELDSRFDGFKLAYEHRVEKIESLFKAAELKDKPDNDLGNEESPEQSKRLKVV